jgi:hypothetical protein
MKKTLPTKLALLSALLQGSSVLVLRLLMVLALRGLALQVLVSRGSSLQARSVSVLVLAKQVNVPVQPGLRKKSVIVLRVSVPP